MTVERITKEQLPLSFGSFKPVGHVVVAVENEEAADQFSQALQDAGFAETDVLHFSGEEWVERVEDLLPEASGMSGFGSEIQHMRQHYMLASDGNSLLIIFAPDKKREDKVAELAKRLGAKVAQSYGRLTVEDLI
ncbi:MAG: hypothetical protein JWP52_1378 [Rhizobacter sp.]|nr:hypothetical protein [Rhizobacter sp.]